MSAGHRLELVILRLANVYGPRDYGRVIPLFVENAVNGRPLTLYGGRQIVDFVHIGDVVDALMKVGFGDHIAGPVNVGSGKGITIAELAERILHLTNSDSGICRMPSRDVEVGRFVADTTRARALGLVHREDPLHGLPELIARATAEARHGLPEFARAAAEAQAARQVLRDIAV